jgi:hypothetical protein
VLFSLDQLAELPAPVARYFEFALEPGQPLIREARLEQTGTFAIRPGRWSPFTAVEHFTMRPLAFLWDARIRLMPLVSARVRDSYTEGEGATRVTVAGLVPMVDLRGTPEMASARASLTDHAVTVSLDVHVGERGEIVSASTMRYRSDARLPYWRGRITGVHYELAPDVA